MFSITYGKQTFGRASDSVSIFSLPLVKGTNWKMDKATVNATYTKDGRSHSLIAARDGFADHGKWYSANYSSQDDSSTVLCIQLTRRVQGTVRAQCTLHIIPHERGPMLNVQACLTPNDNSVQGQSVTVYTGPGYIIDHGQMKSLGIKIDKADISHFMDAEELDDEFLIDNMTGADLSLPNLLQVEEADGTVTSVIAAPVAKRKLRIRKR